MTVKRKVRKPLLNIDARNPDAVTLFNLNPASEARQKLQSELREFDQAIARFRKRHTLKLEEQLAAKAAECERLRKALQAFLAWVDKFRLREMGKTSYTVWFELQPVAKKADTALEEWRPCRK